MRLRTAIPILLTAASVMITGLGLAIAQERAPRIPRVRIPVTEPSAPAAADGDSTRAGKLRPFRTGLEGRGRRRTPPAARVDFTLEDADLPDLVRMIAHLTGKRFILPSKARSIKATVASERPVSAAEAYRAFLSILEIHGMTVVPSGRFYKIVESSGIESRPLPVYTDGTPTPRDDRFMTRMHRVEHISAEDVASLLGRFKSREGNITAYAPTNTIIITDTGANIRRMLRILREIDVPRTGEQIWIEPIHYADATELSSRLQELFPSTGNSGSSSSSGSRTRPATKARPPRRPGKATTSPGANAAGPSTIGSETGESRISSIIPDERTNSLLIVSTERAYMRILEVIRVLDVAVEGEGSIHVHSLQYADAEEMATTIQTLIGGGSRGGSASSKRPSKARPQPARPARRAGTTSFAGNIAVQAHKPTNSLLITSSMHDYVSLRRVLERLDVAPRQVFIEAVIMQLNVTRRSRLGFAFHGGAPISTGDDTTLSLFGFQPEQTAVGLQGALTNPDVLQSLALGIQGPEIEGSNQLLGFSVPSFGMLMNAFASSGDTDILSTPHLLVMDNTQAEITVGQNVPLQTNGIAGLGAGLGGLASQAGGAAGGIGGLGALAGLGAMGGMGGAGIQRQNVGTTIRVTPHINDSGEIRLEIEEEISEAGASEGSLGVVPIQQRMAKTQVLVRDQQTVVIGGLIRDTQRNTERKIPVLGDIPLLGMLFRHTETQTVKENLLLIMTPYVVRGPEDLRAIYQRRLRERQDFIDRFLVSSDRTYERAIDYSRTRGLLAEILNTVSHTMEREEMERALEAQPPPEHFPRPPIGASPEESGDGDTLIITPESAASASTNASAGQN